MTTIYWLLVTMLYTTRKLSVKTLLTTYQREVTRNMTPCILPRITFLVAWLRANVMRVWPLHLKFELTNQDSADGKNSTVLDTGKALKSSNVSNRRRHGKFKKRDLNSKNYARIVKRNKYETFCVSTPQMWCQRLTTRSLHACWVWPGKIIVILLEQNMLFLFKLNSEFSS